MSQRVIELPDGEELPYEETATGLLGPCPRCFLVARNSRSLEDAVKQTTIELRWRGTLRVLHLGCSAWTIKGDTWVQE